jgi:hypothetical protein
LKVADFSGNGKPDVLINQFVGQDAGVSVLTVLPGDGHGGFQAPIKLDTGEGTFIDLAVGDFNGDGKLGFAVTDNGAGALVFSGNGDGTFAPPVFFPSGGPIPFGLATADLTGNGLPDMVVANTFSNTVGVLLNTSTVATTTALSADVNPAVVGQTVNLTAMVTRAAGIPTGTVTFMDGTTVLGTATLDNTGTATLAVTFPAAGDHALTAVYRGQGSSTSSTSDVLTEAVTAAAPDHLAFTNPDTVTAGSPFQITVTVEDALDNPVTGFTGTVHFTASNGASRDFTFSPGDAGTHTFTVTLFQAGPLTITGTDTGGTGATGTILQPFDFRLFQDLGAACDQATR